MLLNDIKILLGIDEADSSQDKLLNLYVKRAIYTIKNYLNSDKITDDEIVLLHSEAIKSLVVDARKIETTSGEQGIKSITQGARSVTYADNKSFEMTSSIKALLPTPFIKMR